ALRDAREAGRPALLRARRARHAAQVGRAGEARDQEPRRALQHAPHGARLRAQLLRPRLARRARRRSSAMSPLSEKRETNHGGTEDTEAGTERGLGSHSVELIDGEGSVRSSSSLLLLFP